MGIAISGTIQFYTQAWPRWQKYLGRAEAHPSGRCRMVRAPLRFGLPGSVSFNKRSIVQLAATQHPPKAELVCHGPFVFVGP